MIEKYTNGAMVEVGYDRYETSTDTYTSFPTELIADSISAYTIKGNMEQNGTPTPSSPIQPLEVGILESTGEHAGEYKIPILSGGVTTNIYIDAPLRKIGAYADYIDSVNGKLYRKIVTHIFMGTDDDSYSLNSDNTTTLAVNVNPDKVTQPAIKTTSNSKIYSDKLTYITNTSDVEHIYLTNGTAIDVGYRAAIRIYIDKSRLSGYSPTMSNAEKIELVKTWLQNNPLTAYYITYTPTEENIELPNIPTGGTAEQFDVDTPIKPLEVELTYTGWHNKLDTKY